MTEDFKQLGDVATKVVADLRLRMLVNHLHGLGPRSLYEFLSALGAERSVMTAIESKLELYRILTMDDIEACGGSDLPPAALHVVKKGAAE